MDGGYDGVAELQSSLLPFGSWTQNTLYRKQYTDKGTAGGVFPLDLNVERSAEPVPVPDPAQSYADGVRAGRQSAADQMQATVDAIRAG